MLLLNNNSSNSSSSASTSKGASSGTSALDKRVVGVVIEEGDEVCDAVY